MNARKQEVLAALRARLAADLESATARQREAHAAAIHEEARPENDKDTQATEASYVARGLAQRVEELAASLGQLGALVVRRFGPEDAIALSALVSVEDDGGEATTYFLAPTGGGLRLALGSGDVTVITPTAPLGRALIGRRVDDEIEVKTSPAARTLTVTAVA